jgi:AraC-like DNA-binding protein
MLRVRTLLQSEGLEISDVACRHRHGRGTHEQHGDAYAIVYVRRGRFVRDAEGVQSLLDPTVGYCIKPGEEHRYDHLDDDGDDCTSLFVEPELLASVWGGDPDLPSGPLPISPSIDLDHRLLLSAARRGADAHELGERAIVLGARTLEQVDARRVARGRPQTERARRAAADGVRELLALDSERSLPELAGALSVSPHHLSRVFRAATGHTISRHRMRLRVRAAMERLAGGERDLARLAAELGFADQSHLCRVVRQETGSSPAALRDALSYSATAPDPAP